MRRIILFIILTISFNGYSAAAHAFGSDSCDATTMLQMVNNDIDMSDCSDHKSEQNKKTDNDKSKSSKAKCIDCTHCCASHAIGLSSYDLGLSVPEGDSILPPLLEARHKSDFIASMIRPPISLV